MQGRRTLDILYRGLLHLWILSLGSLWSLPWIGGTVTVWDSYKVFGSLKSRTPNHYSSASDMYLQLPPFLLRVVALQSPSQSWTPYTPHRLENKQNIQKHLIHSILGLSSSSVSSSCSSSDSSSMVTPCPGLNHFSLVSTSTFSRLGRGDTPWRSRRLEGVGADAAASTWSTLKLGRSNSLGSDVPVDQLARAASSMSSHCCKMIAWASSRERNIKFLKQSKSALTRLHKLQQPKKKLQECIASNSTSSDKSSVRDWPSNFVKAAAADCKSMAPTDQIETMNPETPKSVAQSTWQTRKKKTISDDSWSPFSWHTSVVWVVIDDMDPISFALKHVRCFQHTKEKWECEKTKLEISCNINNLLCCFSNRSLMQADTIFFSPNWIILGEDVAAHAEHHALNGCPLNPAQKKVTGTKELSWCASRSRLDSNISSFHEDGAMTEIDVLVLWKSENQGWSAKL